METKIFVDTNVLLDYIMKRESYYEDAREIMSLFTSGKKRGCVAAHSITNIFYILRKSYSLKERRALLLNICKIFHVEEITKHKIIDSLVNEKIDDFEDCLQIECAKSYGAHYIITRDVGDYLASEVQAILPKDFLSLYYENE